MKVRTVPGKRAWASGGRPKGGNKEGDPLRKGVVKK